MAATVCVNGRVSSGDTAVISVFDHGFLYGEGIYEMLRTYGGQPFLFDRHMRRMRQSAAMMRLPLPFSDDELARDIARTTEHAAVASAETFIRVLVTRGIGELSYDLRATPTPSVVIIVGPLKEPPASAYTEGVAVALVDVVRNHPSTVDPTIKSNNLINLAMAQQEALRRGAFEGVMRNYRGELVECSTANLFIVRDGAVFTPPIDAGLLPGITREFVLDIAPAAGVRVEEATLQDEDLFGADEAFLTSTTREIVPIVRVDERPIGSGTPGPVTHGLLAEFRRRARVPEPSAPAR
jgi:branched-chain amino acid aminotransferase